MSNNKSSLSKELEERLNELPRKERMVLSGLYSIGHLDGLTLETVLDAGKLANDCTKIAAFAISYLSLKAKGVPVADVVYMSKQQNRRINLWWSPKRWETEHQKLARSATLRQLATENTQYDVSYFKKHLPNYYPGYVINSSRRLGMEGLRQRHCVASWHDKLLHGYTAICCVFIDRSRWTVELIKTGNDEYPIRIGQLKSKFNGNPSVEIRKAIMAHLAILEPDKTVVNAQLKADWRKKAATIIPALRERQVQHVAVSFSGSGDAGCIDSVTVEPDSVAYDRVVVNKLHRAWNSGTWTANEVMEETTLTEAISEMCYDYLEETGIDWHNDGGGQGELVIDMDSEELSMYIDVNYTESETAFSSEWALADLTNANDGQRTAA